MKLTDMAIVFHLFCICIITVLHVKSANIHGETVNEIMYNNVMDGIVEDSLLAGYKTVDNQGYPVVNLEEIRRCFVAEKGLYSSNDRHILVYVDRECFYVWDSDKSWDWSDGINFVYEDKTAHEQKVYQLIDYIEERYVCSIVLPFNDGETILNTVDDYSLIAMSFNRNSEVKCFSAAKIHKVNRTAAD